MGFSEPHPQDEDIVQKIYNVPNEPAWNHTKFFEDVIASTQNQRRGLIDGLEVRKSIEIINAIYESAETGKEVFAAAPQKKCRLGLE